MAHKQALSKITGGGGSRDVLPDLCGTPLYVMIPLAQAGGNCPEIFTRSQSEWRKKDCNSLACFANFFKGGMRAFNKKCNYMTQQKVPVKLQQSISADGLHCCLSFSDTFTVSCLSESECHPTRSLTLGCSGPGWVIRWCLTKKLKCL